MRVLPSTAGRATWVVITQGCESSSSTCSDARGGLVNINASTSRTDSGIYGLDLDQNFGYNGSGEYNLDTVALGLSNDTGGPSLDSQIMVGIETNRYRLGMFGLNNQPQNISTFQNAKESFLSTLKSSRFIPSLSWAYTAGAHYRTYTHLYNDSMPHYLFRHAEIALKYLPHSSLSFESVRCHVANSDI